MEERDDQSVCDQLNIVLEQLAQAKQDHNFDFANLIKEDGSDWANRKECQDFEDILCSIDDHGKLLIDGQESKKYHKQNVMLSNDEDGSVSTDGKESKTSNHNFDFATSTSAIHEDALILINEDEHEWTNAKECQKFAIF